MRIVKKARARSTGTTVLVIDNREREWNEDGDWYTVCDDHGEIVSHLTRKLAVWHSPAPEEWCSQCREASS